MPLAHISLPISSVPLSEARDFYLAALSPLGYEIFMEIEDKTIGMKTRFGPPDFWLHFKEEEVQRNDLGMPIWRRSKEEVEEMEARKKTGVHVAFAAGSRRVVREFYRVALKAGATDNGKPGERYYTKGYYAAYVLDLEGNNIECVYYQPWWLSAIQLAPLTLGGIALGCIAWYAGRAGWSW